jgi:hypothetical protein
MSNATNTPAATKVPPTIENIVAALAEYSFSTTPIREIRTKREHNCMNHKESFTVAKQFGCKQRHSFGTNEETTDYYQYMYRELFALVPPRKKWNGLRILVRCV